MQNIEVDLAREERLAILDCLDGAEGHATIEREDHDVIHARDRHGLPLGIIAPIVHERGDVGLIGITLAHRLTEINGTQEDPGAGRSGRDRDMGYRGLAVPGNREVHDDSLAGNRALRLSGDLDYAGREVRRLVDGLAVLIFHDGELEGILVYLNACNRDTATTRASTDRRDGGELVIAFCCREVRLYIRLRVAVANEVRDAHATRVVMWDHVSLLTWRSRLSLAQLSTDRIFAQMPCSLSCHRRLRFSHRAKSPTCESLRCRRHGCRTAWFQTS